MERGGSKVKDCRRMERSMRNNRAVVGVGIPAVRVGERMCRRSTRSGWGIEGRRMTLCLDRSFLYVRNGERDKIKRKGT